MARSTARRSSESPGGSMADRLVDAATRIIVRDGYRALTVQAVEREVGTSQSSIHYYFGGKDGLVLAVVDALFKGLEDAARNPAPSGDPVEGLDAMIDSDQALSSDRDYMRLYVELLPHLLRSEELTTRLREYFRRAWYQGAAGGQANRDEVGMQPDDHSDDMWATLTAEFDEEAVAGVSYLMAAMVDGLGLQYLVDPDGVDHAARYRVWREMLLAYLQGHRKAQSGTA